MLSSQPATPRPRPPNLRARSSTNRRQASISGNPKPSSSLSTMALYTSQDQTEEETLEPTVRPALTTGSPTKRAHLTSSLQLSGVPFPAVEDSTPPHLSLQLPPPPYPSSPPNGAHAPSQPGGSPAADGQTGSHERTGSTSPAGSQTTSQAKSPRGSEHVTVDAGGMGGGVTKEWVQGKTREELDSLLLEADRVIRLREAELTEAAIYGQKLAKENIDLRNRRESVLQSIPRNPPQTQPARRTPRPSLTSAPSWLTDNGDDEQAARDAEEREEGFSPTRTPTHSFGRSAAKMMRGGSASSGGNAGDPGWVFGRGQSRHSNGGGRDSISSSLAPTPTTSTFSGYTSPPRGKRTSSMSISSPHRRTPSLVAHPSAVVYLREQNDELLHQYEQLQVEATDADHEGKKRLRKLEKEIGALRAQLEGLEGVNEQLNEKNEQLEQKLHRKVAAAGSDDKGSDRNDGGWGERRRLRLEREWEEKNKQYGGIAVSSSTPVMPSLHRHGSAPPSSMSRRTPSPTTHLQQQHSCRSPSSTSTDSTLSPPASPRTRSISLLGPSLSAQTSPLRQPSLGLTPSPSTHGDSTRPRSAAELAVVTQLLGKMRELESVDEHFRLQRQEHARRLSRVQHEGASLATMYAGLETDLTKAGLEIVDVAPQQPMRRRGSDQSSLAPPGPRTPSRQADPSWRAREDSPLDRTNASTPNKSPSTVALQLNFFSTSPSSTTNLHLGVPFPARSKSPSTSATPSRRPSPQGNRSTAPPSPSSPSVAYDPAYSSDSVRFRSAVGNRQMIETNRLRKKMSTSTFLSPSDPPARPIPRDRRHLRDSVTPSPTAVHGFGGSPLKMRHDVGPDEVSPSRTRGRSWEDEARSANVGQSVNGQDDEDQYEDEEDDRSYYQCSPRRPTQRRADLTPRTKRDVRLAAMPSLVSLGSWGRAPPRGRPLAVEALSAHAGRTLGSELGSQSLAVQGGGQYGRSLSIAGDDEERDWEDDDDYDEDYYGSAAGYGDDSSSYGPGSSLIARPTHPTDVAMHSVQRALASREAGLYLDTSTPILPPGSLALAPPDPETFDLLEMAVGQRPIRWSDDSDQYGIDTVSPHQPPAVMSLWDYIPSLLPKADADPFETEIYPEPGFPSEEDCRARLHFRERRIREAVEAGEDPLSQEVLRPPTKRELALQRLGLESPSTPSSPFGTMRRRRAGREDDDAEEEFEMIEGERRGRKLLSAPTDGPSDWLTRMKAANVLDRVTRRWVSGIMDIWFFLQIMVVAVVFMVEMMRTGRKQIKTIDRKQRREPRRIA